MNMLGRERFTTSAETVLTHASRLLHGQRRASATAAVLRALGESGSANIKTTFEELRMDIPALLTEVEQRQRAAGDSRSIPLEAFKRRSRNIADRMGHSRASAEHLLLAIVTMRDDYTAGALRGAGLTEEVAFEQVQKFPSVVTAPPRYYAREALMV
jgi:ATP-dependent Clp protease ATP-binding subunit ClpA